MLSPANPPAAGPFRLEQSSSIEIHTTIAIRYFLGRVGKGNGALQFAQQMRAIWRAVKQNDPYADQALIDIEAALETARKNIQEQLAEAASLLTSQPGVRIEAARSLQPFMLPLRFATPYGFQAAFMIGEFDQFVRTVRTARALGMHAPDDEVLYAAGSIIKAALEQPKKWHATGVTRIDVRKQTEIAKKAHALMGKLRLDVMACAKRAYHAPKINIAFALADLEKK